MFSISEDLTQTCDIAAEFTVDEYGNKTLVYNYYNIPCRFADGSGVIKTEYGEDREILPVMEFDETVCLNKGYFVEINDQVYQIERVEKTPDFDGNVFLQYVHLSHYPIS